MSTSSTSRPAVLFDIDGTLVDSNYLHVQAWAEAFEAVGHPVEAARIHRAIGMDSAKLLDALLGSEVQRYGESAKASHADRYQHLSGRLRLFGRARDLLKAVSTRGFQVVLATSAPQQELTHLLTVLDADEWTDKVTSAEDVETAKPEPEVITVALQKAGVSADRAVMVGDTVWDGEAAGRAGVLFIGVRSGGIGEPELRAAGAVAVYDDVAGLLDELDTGPTAALLR